MPMRPRQHWGAGGQRSRAERQHAALAERYAPGLDADVARRFSSARRFSGTGFGVHGDWVLGAPNALLDAAGATATASAAMATRRRQQRNRRQRWWTRRPARAAALLLARTW